MPGISDDYTAAAILALAALHLALGLAAAGIPWVSGVGGFRIAKRSKIFMNKFGQQVGTFALLAGLYVGLALIAAVFVMRGRLPEVAAFWFTAPLPLYPLAASLFCGLAAFLLYRGLWQPMKERKKTHALLGLAAALFLWFFLYVALCAFRLFAQELDLPNEAALFFLPPADSSFWPTLGAALSASLSLAGTFCAGYLLKRRSKDDFGRDYYNFALRLAARWAFFAGAVQFFCAGWLTAVLWPHQSLLPSPDGFLLWLGGAASLGLACLALWGVVSFQTNALRFKVMIVSAFALSLAWFVVQALAFAPFYLS